MALSCQNSRDLFTFSCDPPLILTDSLIGFVYEQIQAPEFNIGPYLNPVPVPDQQETVPTAHHDAEPKSAVYEKIHTPEFDIGEYLNPVPTTDQNAEFIPGKETVRGNQHSADDAEPKPEVYVQIHTPEFDINQYLNPVPTNDNDAEFIPGQETVLEIHQNTEIKPARAEVTVPTAHDAEPEPAVYEHIHAPGFDIGEQLNPVPITDQNADLVPGQKQETVLEIQHDAEPEPTLIMVPTTEYNSEPKKAQIMVPTAQYNPEANPAEIMVPTTQYNSEPNPEQIMVPTTEYNVPIFNSSQLTAPFMPTLHQDPLYTTAPNSCQAEIQYTPSNFVQYQQIHNTRFNTTTYNITNPAHIPYQNPITGRAHGVLAQAFKPAFKPVTAQSVAARVRRKRISDKTQELASLIPGGTRMNTADMLSVGYKYVGFLKAQVGVLALMDSSSDEAREVPSTVEAYMRSLLGSTSVQEYLSAHGKCLVPKKLAVNLSKEMMMQSNVPLSNELQRFVESIKNN